MRATDRRFTCGLDISIHVFSFEHWADTGLFYGVPLSCWTAVKWGMELEHTEGIKNFCFNKMEITYAHTPWTKVSHTAKYKVSEVVIVLCREILVTSWFHLSQQAWALELRWGGWCCQSVHTQPWSSRSPSLCSSHFWPLCPLFESQQKPNAWEIMHGILQCQFPGSRNRMEKGSEFIVQAHTEDGLVVVWAIIKLLKLQKKNAL